MAMIHSPDTNESKERVKWEAQYTPMGPPQRPYVFRPYPARIYLAGRPESGAGIAIIEELEVGSDIEEAQHHSRGFRQTPLEAIDAFKRQQAEFGALAAERNYDVKNKLSHKAAAEVAEAENQHAGHMPSMPNTPIKRRVRKTNAKE